MTEKKILIAVAMIIWTGCLRQRNAESDLCDAHTDAVTYIAGDSISKIAGLPKGLHVVLNKSAKLLLPDVHYVAYVIEGEAIVEIDSVEARGATFTFVAGKAIFQAKHTTVNVAPILIADQTTGLTDALGSRRLSLIAGTIKVNHCGSDESWLTIEHPTNVTILTEQNSGTIWQEPLSIPAWLND